MKIIVDIRNCAGHARCNAVAPDIFELDGNGYIAFSEKSIAPDMEAMARRGSRACPERVIKVVDDPPVQN